MDSDASVRTAAIGRRTLVQNVLVSLAMPISSNTFCVTRGPTSTMTIASIHISASTSVSQMARNFCLSRLRRGRML